MPMTFATPEIVEIAGTTHIRLSGSGTADDGDEVVIEGAPPTGELVCVKAYKAGGTIDPEIGHGAAWTATSTAEVWANGAAAESVIAYPARPYKVPDGSDQRIRVALDGTGPITVELLYAVGWR